MSTFVATPLIKFNKHKTSLSNNCNRRPYPIASVSKRIVDIYKGKSLHPVLDIIRHRAETSSKPGRRKDGRKLALCIEGGGMRGAVSAGMVAALKYCGLEDTFDVVYGCSAGAIVGAYFISRQLPVYGAQIYYDTICSIPENGQRFIDLWALRHHPYFGISPQKRSQFYSEGARPVLLLDRLIDTVMCHERPLDWKAFHKTHTLQPLKPVASSLTQMRSHVFESFSTKEELLECLRASARVPGIAGNPVEIDGEFYADGLLFEPIPYRSAIQQGCTDVLVLRTRGDQSLIGKRMKPGIYEKHIASPYFDKFPNFAPRAPASDYLMSGQHISVYYNDLIRLRQENEVPKSFSESSVFSILPPSGAPAVGQLESRAKVVYEGVRTGFAAAYDTLSPFADPILKPRTPEIERNGKDLDDIHMTAGQKVASWVFSDQELKDVESRHKEGRKEKSRASRNARRSRHQTSQKKRQRSRRHNSHDKSRQTTESKTMSRFQ